MVNQTDSKDGVPHKDAARPTADVDQYSTDGQSDKRGKGASDEQGQEPGDSPGAGPGKPGLLSDREPGLVAPGGVNQRDHGSAKDAPMAGGGLNFDDEDQTHPRGRTTATGGTWEAEGGDSGKLGAPSAGLSDRNGPSDRDR